MPLHFLCRDMPRGMLNISQTQALKSPKPGFVRLGIHFTMSDEDVELLASAVAPWRMLRV